MVSFHPGRSPDPEQEELHELVEPDLGPHVFEVTENALHVVVAFGPGAHEHEAVYLGGMAQGEFLSDCAAHGETRHVGLSDTLGVHQCGDIVGHHGSGIRTVGDGGLADAAIIDEVAGEMLLVGFDVFFPYGAIGPEAHDQHKGRTFAARGEMQDIAHSGVR